MLVDRTQIRSVEIEPKMELRMFFYYYFFKCNLKDTLKAKTSGIYFIYLLQFMVTNTKKKKKKA